MNERNDPEEAFVKLWTSGSAPDLDVFLAGAGPIDTPQLSSLARIDQQQRWQCGDRRSAEEYLERYSALGADNDSAVDLIYHEFLLREKLAENPSPEEYARRFPQHATALTGQIKLHGALTRASEDGSQAPAASAESDEVPQPPSQLLPKLPAQFG